MFLPIKTAEQLNEESLAQLAGTPITEVSPGGIARLLLAIVNESLAGCYRALELAHLSAFVSTSSGATLDLIGQAVRCYRYPDQSDDEYRYRITKQNLVEATANGTAIRLAALSVPGVKDVVMHEFARGTGSGAVYVVIDDMTLKDEILAQVAVNIEAVHGWGSRIELLTPDLITIELGLVVLFTQDTPEVDRQVIHSQIPAKVASYLNSLLPGQSLLIKEIDTLVRDLSSRIAEVRITSLKRDQRAITVADQNCRWNQRFVQAPTSQSVTVA